MNSEDVQTIQELLSQPQRIVIVPHKNPDGDAIGSSLGLYHYLKGLGQEVVVIAPNDYPKFLKWMPGAKTILNFEKDNQAAVNHLEQATLIFTLDFNHLSRVGDMQAQLEHSKASFVLIDHHQQPDNFARVTYSDVQMSSTCEMIYNFLEYLGALDALTPEIANCLYAGIMTDTGSFKFASTTSRTHQVVASLIEKGANNTLVHEKVYDTNTPDRLKLLGCALNNMVILEDVSTAYITLSQKELDRYNFKKGDTEGFVNYCLTLEGIKLAAIFIENEEEGIIKISLRSQGDFSVNALARKYFNGGGHTNAAGGKSEKGMEETTSLFVSLLNEYKTQLHP